MMDLVLPIQPLESLRRLVRLGSKRRRSSATCRRSRAGRTCTKQEPTSPWDIVGNSCKQQDCDSPVNVVVEDPQPCPTDHDLSLKTNEGLRIDFEEDDYSKDGGALLCIASAQFSEIELLAHGGFGSIYTATWQRPDKGDEKVALKVFNVSDDVNEALFNELSELSRCRFAHFPKIYGVTVVSVSTSASDTRALVMQYCCDGDVRTLLTEEEDSTISWKWRFSILKDTCAALSKAHDDDVLHCNLHSGNILVERLGTNIHSWVSDFGLSRVFNDKENHGAGNYGIIPYMAPELLKGERHTKATDVYALGMVMWELSAGRSPFSDCAHDIDLMLRICSGERPPVVVDTPDCWLQLMKRCWDEDPDNRPTAREVHEELTTWIRFRNNYNVKAIIQLEEAEERRRQRPTLLPLVGSHPQAVRVSRWVPSTRMISEHYELINDDDWEEALANMA